MARHPMVTRTMKVTVAKVLCLNLQTKEPEERDIRISRTYKDERKLFKAIEELVNSADFKAVHVISTTVESVLYGMEEQKFIDNAEILPSRT